MKTIKLLFLFLLVTMQINSQKNEYLKWSNDIKLKWDDFQRLGQEEIRSGGIIAAMTVVYYDYQQLNNGRITPPVAFFDKLKSWSITNDSLALAHEQVHFDIYELYARKMRKDFLNLYSKNINERSQYEQLLDDYFARVEEENSNFDRDSYPFSKPRDENMEWVGKDEFCEVLLRWQEKIRQELKELEAYSLD